MEPLKAEIEALREVMFTPVEDFVSEKERAERGEEWAEKTAHRRMFSQGIKAVDAARGARTTWMVTLRHGPADNCYFTGIGPYATKAQAEKALLRARAAFDPSGWAVSPTRNEDGFADLLTELDAKPVGGGDYAVVADDARMFRKGWDGNQKTRKQFENANQPQGETA